jgi:hypothetical protein
MNQSWGKGKAHGQRSPAGLTRPAIDFEVSNRVFCHSRQGDNEDKNIPDAAEALQDFVGCLYLAT